MKEVNQIDAQLDEVEAKTDTPESGAEKNDKPSELSRERLDNIKRTLEQAQKKGVICKKDIETYQERIKGLNKEDKERAEYFVDRKLKEKERHFVDYRKKIKKAEAGGLLSAPEAKKRLKDYEEKTGKEREEEGKNGFDRFLDIKKKEKKEYETILKESPHFYKNGTFNKEGKLLDAAYKNLREKEKKKEKKRLILRTRILDISLGICKDNYNEARRLFEEGSYDTSMSLMKRNIRTCRRYPESAQLGEYLEWAQGDMKNLEYEIKNADETIEIREDRNDCIKAGDRENALGSSKDLVEKTKRNLQYTYSTKTKTESPRSTKWITAFMKKDEAEASKTHSSLETVYTKLELEDKKEEERADTETQTIDSELAKDKVSQTYIKGATDMSKKSDEDPEAEQEALGHDEEEIIQHDQVHNLSEEQREETTIEIDEDKHGRLQEKQARDILQSDTQIELKKKDRELNTRDEIETELNKRILDQEEKLITRLEKEGKISGDTLAREHQRIKVLKGGKNLGREIMKEADRRENIVVSGREESSAKNVKKVLDSTREQEGGKIINPDEARRKASKKRKSDMIKKIAA